MASFDEGDIGRDCDAPVVVRGSVVARNAQVRGPVVRGRVVASHAPAVAAASNPPAARAAATATLPDQGCDLSRTAISSPALASAAAPPGSGYRAGDEVRVSYGGTWCEGVVQGRSDDGYYTVQYTDGSGFVEPYVAAPRLRGGYLRGTSK